MDVLITYHTFLSAYRQSNFLSQLGLICLLWMLNCVVGWFYFCQIGYICPLTRLFVTYFVGVIFWLLAMPLVNGKIWILKAKFQDPGQRTVAIVLFSLAIIGLNQLVISKAVALSYQVFYDYREPTPSWISSIISNNILINMLFCGFLVASAWLNPNWKGTGTAKIILSDMTDQAGENTVDDPCTGCIHVKEGTTLHKIELSSIRLVQADQNCVHIYADSRKFTIYSSLVRFGQQLNPTIFVRIHRSAIVNIRRIQMVRNLPSGDAEIILDEGTVVKCSRNYKKLLDLRPI